MAPDDHGWHPVKGAPYTVTLDGNATDGPILTIPGSRSANTSTDDSACDCLAANN